MIERSKGANQKSSSMISLDFAQNARQDKTGTSRGDLQEGEIVYTKIAQSTSEHRDQCIELTPFITHSLAKCRD